MSKDLICPLMSMQAHKGFEGHAYEYNCKEEKCAWWLHKYSDEAAKECGCCAIRRIAEKSNG